jgi:hypothetical protein
MTYVPPAIIYVQAAMCVGNLGDAMLGLADSWYTRPPGGTVPLLRHRLQAPCGLEPRIVP